MIQKVLRCTLGIFSGNIYFDIANKPDRRVWLVCSSTEWAWRKSAPQHNLKAVSLFLLDSSLSLLSLCLYLLHQRQIVGTVFPV